MPVAVKELHATPHAKFIPVRAYGLRLREKGGKRHEKPCHHNLEAYLEAYLEGAGLAADPKGPLFRTIGRKTKQLTRTPCPASTPTRWSGGVPPMPASKPKSATIVFAPRASRRI
jgi:hypothetical protein